MRLGNKLGFYMRRLGRKGGGKAIIENNGTAISVFIIPRSHSFRV